MLTPFSSPMKIVIITAYRARRPTRNEKKINILFYKINSNETNLTFLRGTNLIRKM